MKNKFILKKKKEIDFIFRLKKNVKNYFFILYYARNLQFNHFKFALSINRKYGKAHERNLIKRRLRMIIYQYKYLINKQSSFVLVIKPTARELTFSGLEKNFLFLLRKCYLITR
ncbi:MAG: ribonuclease P protein component [Vigna little leaf phytoplasma]|nr:ribonuclease P protein component [Vigna little leaf phytoplasma]MDV3198357.1 ribonuclease P protein component [Vigna little leaf phytoplasma]